MKRVPRGWWWRFRSGIPAGGKTLIGVAAVLGLILAGLAAAGIRVPGWIIFVALALTFLTPVVVAFLRGHTALIPPAVVDEMSADGHYTCGYCSSYQLRTACELARPYYRHEWVSPDVVEQWRLQNPKAFVHITNAENVLCACFGVMALKEGFMNELISGRVRDAQMLAADILPLESSRKSSSIYISGVVVREPHMFRGSKRTWVLLWAMLVYLKQVYGPRKARTLYAIAVTRDSERLMQRLGFTLASEAANREDRCNMYRYVLDKKGREALAHRLGDFSGMCDILF